MKIDQNAPWNPTGAMVNEYGAMLSPASQGASIRTHLAAKAMAAIISGKASNEDLWSDLSWESTALQSLKAADALIAALNTNPEKTGT